MLPRIPSSRCRTLTLACPIAGLIVVLSTHAVLSQGSDLGGWIARAPLPTPRQEMPHAVLEGKIYVTGGLDRIPSGSTLVEVFDPSTNLWETKAEMPFPLHHHGVATVNGKLYVLGGYQRNTFNSTTHLFEYDPATDTWTILDDMPTSRGAHGTAVLNGKIYVTGGTSFGATIGSVDVYDPTSGAWETAAPLLTAREHHTAAVVNSTLYVIGGRVPALGNVDLVEAYDPITNEWTRKTAMPTARSGLASAGYRGRIFVFGGEIPGVYDENEMYDATSDTWTGMASMPTARHGIGAAVVGDTIFVIGGAPNQGLGLTSVNEGYVPPASIITRPELDEVPVSAMTVDAYPNPTSGPASLRLGSVHSGVASIAVVDVLGRAVRAVKTNVAAHSLTEATLPTGGLPAGIYFVNVALSTNPGGNNDRLIPIGTTTLIITGTH